MNSEWTSIYNVNKHDSQLRNVEFYSFIELKSLKQQDLYTPTLQFYLVIVNFSIVEVVVHVHDTFCSLLSVLHHQWSVNCVIHLLRQQNYYAKSTRQLSEKSTKSIHSHFVRSRILITQFRGFFVHNFLVSKQFNLNYTRTNVIFLQYIP